jgi:NADH-quinone oxidoreductase subunit J
MSALLAQAPSTPATTFDVPANVVFAIVAVTMIFAAIRLVTTKNIVHAALWLVVVLSGVGLNYLLLQAEFVAVTQFLVYIGAIVVLLLFGVMLTRAPLGVAEDLDNVRQRPIAIVIGLALLAVFTFALVETFGTEQLTFAAYENVVEPNTNPRTGVVADAIFGQYLIPFEMISVLLLAALIGAIVLARRD